MEYFKMDQDDLFGEDKKSLGFKVKKNIDSIYFNQFNSLWEIYPAVGAKKGSKQKAFDSFIKVLPTYGFEAIKKGLFAQIAEREIMKKNGIWVANFRQMVTWLNQVGFLDDVATEAEIMLEAKREAINGKQTKSPIVGPAKLSEMFSSIRNKNKPF